MSLPLLDLDRLKRDSFVAAFDWHQALASTNDRGLELAACETLETPLLVIAEHQSAGRGRGHNRWWSHSGALTLSLVLEPTRVGALELRTEHWPRVALTAGVALCEVLETLTPHLAYGFKWPNDVLLAGKKVAGILVEVPPAKPPIPRRLVLGMGVNVNNSFGDAPAEIALVGTSLVDATGLEFDATDLLLKWLARFAEGLQALAADDPALAAGWQSRSVLTDRRVELQAGERIVHGICRGIDDTGALILETATGLERLFGGVLVRVCN